MERGVASLSLRKHAELLTRGKKVPCRQEKGKESMGKGFFVIFLFPRWGKKDVFFPKRKEGKRGIKKTSTVEVYSQRKWGIWQKRKKRGKNLSLHICAKGKGASFFDGGGKGLSRGKKKGVPPGPLQEEEKEKVFPFIPIKIREEKGDLRD